MLKIDTAGTPSSVAAPAPQQSQAAAAAAPAPAPAAPAAAAAATDHHEGKRRPLIKFLGKRSHAPASAAVVLAGAGQAPLVRYEDIKGTPGAKLFNELPPMFGRLPLSPQEVAAVESGGAD